MVTESGLKLRKTVPFLLLGVLVFVAYLHFFVGIPEILAIIRHVDLFCYGLAVAVLFLNMAVNSLTWQYLLSPLSVKVSFRKNFLFTWIGFFVDLLVPAESISGDATKAYLMTKESNENGGKVLASVVSHRILLMVTALVSLIVSFVWLYVLNIEVPVLVSGLVLLIIVGTAVSLFFIFLFSLKERLAQKLIDAVLRFVSFVTRGRLDIDRLRATAVKALSAFHGSIDVLLRKPRSLVLPIVFSVIGWFFSVLLSYLVFVSLGQHVDFAVIVVVHSVSMSIQSIPLGIPGEVGVVDTAMTWLFTLLTVESVVAAAATVLIRLLWVWLRIAIGFVAVQWIDLKDLAEHLRKDLL
ncbi:MAG TPA: flippase-like domain-containing protein [Candidatus Bathyarchaeota archaeon]|nr:flippase-like domain-containing protein [Candidatus Bathyarchaeota archaeon]